MPNLSTSGEARPRRIGQQGLGAGQLPLEHYLRLLMHRKWLILGVFLTASVSTAVFSYFLPNVYTAETVILVDPQKVPESYVKATVSGDVRNRLGTLSQQILSATRLQRIIDTSNLFPEEKKNLTREELILRMRSNIEVQVLSDFSGSQDLQAFRLRYSGKDPRLVAQVTNDLAAQFIDENLKAREDQATGTTDFLQNQLQEARRALEEQEAKLKDFKLKHLGEMPEQQVASLQILGQLQSQLQLRGEALSRAEQQRSYTLNLMAGQSAPVVDLDSNELRGQNAFGGNPSAPGPISALERDKARLAELLARYKDTYPDVKKLKKRIEEQEAKQAASVEEKPASAVAESAPPPPPAEKPSAQARSNFNPVLQSQLATIDAEIAQNKAEVKRLTGLIGSYQAKLEAIPIREQQITQLARDYEISKAHYGQILNNQFSAETATQLEIRAEG